MLWTVVLEKTLESPLDCKEIQPVHPKGNQSWIFIWRTDAEAETLILLPPDVKNGLTGKKPWCRERLKAGEEGTTEDEMVGWHHQLNGHESEQALGVGDGQGSLVCCSPWGRRVRHNWVTERNCLFTFSQIFPPSLFYAGRNCCTLSYDESDYYPSHFSFQKIGLGVKQGLSQREGWQSTGNNRRWLLSTTLFFSQQRQAMMPASVAWFWGPAYPGSRASRGPAMLV